MLSYENIENARVLLSLSAARSLHLPADLPPLALLLACRWCHMCLDTSLAPLVQHPPPGAVAGSGEYWEVHEHLFGGRMGWRRENEQTAYARAQLVGKVFKKMNEALATT